MVRFGAWNCFLDEIFISIYLLDIKASCMRFQALVLHYPPHFHVMFSCFWVFAFLNAKVAVDDTHFIARKWG